MRNFDCVIFDVDGTLVSSLKLILDSMNHIARKYLNKTFSDKEILDLFGPTEEAIIKKLYNERFEEAEKDYFNFYSDNHSEVDIFNGMKEIIQELKDRNVKLAVFTGKGKRSTEITLEKSGYNNLFEILITGDDVKECKPSGEGIIKILDYFDVSKDKTLMIGDSSHDVIAAQDAGVKIASVLWDSFSLEEIIKLKPDYLFKNLDELKIFLFENT